MRITLFLTLVLAGCVSGAADTDGDRLSDEFEALIGTNPELRDSDGDGFTDAEEHLQYFDANDLGDHPSDGSYPRLAVPREIEFTGWGEGDVSDSWQREDQYGELVDLHSFYGNVILVAVMAEYVERCQNEAIEQADAYEEFADRGLMVVHLLVDGDPEGSPANPSRWDDSWDLGYAVLDQNEQDLLGAYVEFENDSFNVPSWTLIDRTMTIRSWYDTEPFDVDAVEDLLDEEVPFVDWPMPANTRELRDALGLRVIADDDATLDGKFVDASLSASVEGDLAAGLGRNDFAPVDERGNAARSPFGGGECAASLAGRSSLPVLLLLPFLRRRRHPGR